ncbi:hypothetical protein F0357_04185 [Rhizobiales bacterium Sp-1]|uniref:Excalibur calcium-binding domain-containing protein n=1 Tax=Segnochrobactrum spirostomi TaxID=2608987 RepID=A0A6A7XZB3_9HYPH|nr:hypothetical protein [Segnochrobactrum spirostomi]
MSWPSGRTVRPPKATLVAGATCKTVSTCKAAVKLWCSGHRPAAGDGDGVPCENVCHGLEQVNKIREKIDC